MQKGQIIRRKLNDGTPVGPYMRIVRFTHTHVVAQRIIRYSCAGYDNEELFILRSHVYEPVVCKLVLSSVIWERVNAERQRSIIHDICPKWEHIMDKEPEVICMTCFNYPLKRAIFSVDQMRYVWYGREKQLRLDLGERIL